MSIKRLKHHAQNLGQMFCGWELMFDYHRLAEMEEGVLILNVLSEECFHNGNKISPLNIVKGLKNWMIQDLERNNLSLDKISLAELQVKFATSKVPKDSIQNESWSNPAPFFIKCVLDCSSKVEHDERKYTSSYQDVENWPEGFRCKNA